MNKLTKLASLVLAAGIIGATAAPTAFATDNNSTSINQNLGGGTSSSSSSTTTSSSSATETSTTTTQATTTASSTAPESKPAEKLPEAGASDAAIGLAVMAGAGVLGAFAIPGKRDKK